MSNEEFERRMGFVLEQQAKFEENFAKQLEHNAQVDRRIAELVGFTGALRDALIGLTHHAERHDLQR